jgi:hypothetical protein
LIRSGLQVMNCDVQRIPNEIKAFVFGRAPAKLNY